MARDETIVEVEDLIFHFETPVYYCISIEEDKFDVEADRIFLSKEIADKEGDVFLMPQWYAEKKELV